MALSLYDASIPVLLNGLRNLAALLAKAETHAAATGVDPAGYLDARLAPDMHNLTRQVQIATDGAKGAAARLAGIAPPSFPDTEVTWDEVKARIDRTIAFLETIARDQVEGREDAVVELPLPGRTMTFTGSSFLLTFALPNFFFHVVTAYGLLRHMGVPLGKMDYLAGGANASA